MTRKFIYRKTRAIWIISNVLPNRGVAAKSTREFMTRTIEI